MNLAEKLKMFSEQKPLSDSFQNKNDRVLLIDGMNVYIRCFAAIPTLNDNGEHIGGFTGFLRSIGQAIRIIRPSRCIIVFDGKGGSKKRREIFSEYKENRKSMTKLNRAYDFDSKEAELENQKRQLIQLVTAMEFLPLTVISADNVEADDVLAYLAKLVSERGGESYIMSNDKDFLQLVDESIRIYNPTKKKIYTEDAVVEEYGIHPSNFMIFRTIDGDSSDNIPGVKGVGPATLIKNFPELASDKSIPWAHIYAQCEEKIEAAKQAKKRNAACETILNNKETIERNMTLMRLDEQHMSGHTRIKVLDQFDAPINSLNKLSLTQLFVKHRLMGGFTNLDEWLTSTFVPLTRHSEKS